MKSQQQKPKPQAPPSLPEKVQVAQGQAQKFQAIALSPELSPQAAEVARNLERSWTAAATLGQKALHHEAQKMPHDEPT